MLQWLSFFRHDAELGTVYRFERSGVLHGLTRVRGFTQDDAHVFCRPNQLHQEIINVIEFLLFILRTFGFSEYQVYLSTKPEKAVGTDENWELATDALRAALEATSLPYEIDPGEGVFYGPKIDLHIKDALGRTWQCGTIQLDMANPERFNLNYIDKDNQRHRPIMIHRTVFGSIERFLGILIEHFAGKFPLWMAPIQAIILPLNDDLVPYSNQINAILKNGGVRVEVDSRTESLNKKVREAQLNYIPLILTIGGKEKEAGTLAVRTLDGKVKYGVSHETFLSTVLPHIRNRELSLEIFNE